jgi:SET and MYND domain-containing protein
MFQLADLSGNNHPSVKELEQYGLEYGTIIWGLLYEMEGNVGKSHGKESKFAKMVRSKFEELKVDMTRGGAHMYKNLNQSALDTEWAKMRKIAGLS